MTDIIIPAHEAKNLADLPDEAWEAGRDDAARLLGGDQ